MKIIDILNKKADGTLEDGFKFKYNYETFVYKNEEIIDNIGRNIGCLFHLDIHLNNEVEVIEEDKEIEEIEGISYNFEKTSYTAVELSSNFKTITELLNKQSNKINELTRAVNKINSQLTVK